MEQKEKRKGEIDTAFIIGCTPTEGRGELHRPWMQRLPSKSPWLSSRH